MLAQTPPMGWNSWNTFGEKINEQVVKDTADAIVALGLKDVGYEYVVIDDCWSLLERDENGRLVADPEKFPSGMKALADYVHSKGLKFGIYSCVGFLTCAEYPGSFDHEFEDAQTFADWGVDFLKYDFCYKPSRVNGPLLYQRMSMALKATGREILFSACNWGRDDVETWIRSTGAHMYRSTGDIGDNFQCMKEIAVSQYDKLAYSLPGCFNDIDMLICGMHGNGNVALGGCTEEEYNKLTQGTKIKVTGYKAEWAGEVEIIDAKFEILEGNYVASALDVTDKLGTEELINFQNQLVSFKGMTVKSIAYKNDKPGDDIYVTVSKDDADYDFCVEMYLTSPESDTYKAVCELKEGDVIDVEGFLYWYEGVNTHITAVSAAE